MHNKATSEQQSTPYKFTSKELDEETGLYYYGARYYDAKLSRWISADPPISKGEYFPLPPINDKAKEHNSKLPGMGGVFNPINLDAYHYAGQNPVKLVDPDGNSSMDGVKLNVGDTMIVNRDGANYYKLTVTFVNGAVSKIDSPGSLQISAGKKSLITFELQKVERANFSNVLETLDPITLTNYTDQTKIFDVGSVAAKASVYEDSGANTPRSSIERIFEKLTKHNWESDRKEIKKGVDKVIDPILDRNKEPKHTVEFDFKEIKIPDKTHD